jgi:antitoxin component of MazEF toxin-antitoxin module
MPSQSNPRKLYQSGNGTVVSFPQEILDEVGLQKGDRVLMKVEGGQIILEKAQFRRVTDE